MFNLISFDQTSVDIRK